MRGECREDSFRAWQRDHGGPPTCLHGGVLVLGVAVRVDGSAGFSLASRVKAGQQGLVVRSGPGLGSWGGLGTGI